MKYRDLEKMQNFDEKNLPSLSECVKGSLELFILNGIPKLKMKKLKNPLILGSGNAINTAKILFSSSNVIFGNENNYKDLSKNKNIDGVIIFSASGEKHAPIMAKFLINKKLPVYLLTCNPNSSAMEIVGEKNTIITLKNKEPYTYNTSTYLGWVLAFTKEDPSFILNFINKKVEPKIPSNLNTYKGFVVLTPERFSLINGLIDVKFKELFGRRIARDICTFEELKHAVTVIKYDKELCIKFGNNDIVYDGEVIEIPLPDNCDIGAMMAISYYVVGRIQEQMPQYFNKNISNYIKMMNKTEFGKNLKVIVE